MWLTGIDEAGYGPTLGPLVVTAVTLEVPDDTPASDLWSTLSAAVGKPGESCGDRLLVGDSKQIYTRSRGLGNLELTCLAFARQLPGFRDLSLLSFLKTLNAKTDLIRNDGPWYEAISLPLPEACSEDELDVCTAALCQAMDRARVGLVSVRSIIAPPTHFNRALVSTGNKATLLFELCSTILQKVLVHPHRHSVAIDKHGGRTFYASLLMSNGIPVLSVNENRRKSTYTLDLAHGRACSLEFAEGGDRHHFTVALASMFSKYVRELLMIPFNKYWQDLIPGLRPTAGYAVDARRFLQEIETERLQQGIELSRMRRER